MGQLYRDGAGSWRVLCIVEFEGRIDTYGGVAERSNAPVLKTGVSQGTVSSNLTPSAFDMSRIYTGIVKKGAERGRTLGYPTANVVVEGDESGIFAAEVSFNGTQYHAAVFIDPERTILEAYVLDFDGDLYGKEISVVLKKKIRDSASFPDDATLRAAIARDVEAVRHHFRSA